MSPGLVQFGQVSGDPGSGCGTVDRSGDPCLSVEFVTEDVPGQLDADRPGSGHRLGASQPRMIQAQGRGGDEHSAVGGDVDEGDASVREPADGFEGDVASVAEKHQPPETVGCTAEASGPAIGAPSIFDGEMPLVDVDADSPTVGNKHAVAEFRLIEG
jgi:hypothetical protein